MAKQNEDFSNSLVRLTGTALVLRAAIFWICEISIMKGYADRGVINEYSGALFCSYFYFVYAVVVGFYLMRIFMGSSYARFRDKLKSLNPNESNPRPKYVKPLPAALSPRRAAVLLGVDLLAAVALELAIPALPRLYSLMILEFVCFCFALRAAANN